MPIFHDPTGAQVPHGKVTRTKTADFIDGAMPSWLEASTGTASFVTPANGFGHCQLATGATIDNDATLRTTFEFDPQYFRAIRWTAQALCMDTDTEGEFHIGITNAAETTGALVYHLVSQGTARLSGRGSGTTTVIVPYQIVGQGEGPRRRNLSVLWLPQDDEAYLLTDDQPIGFLNAAALNPVGLCRGYLKIITKAAVAHNFKVSQVRLDLTHN